MDPSGAGKRTTCVTMKRDLLFFVLLLLPVEGMCGPLTAERADQFIDALINKRHTLEQFVNSSALSTAERLGIQYEDVDHKFLISYDVDKVTRAKTDSGLVGRDLSVLDSAQSITRLTLTVPGLEHDLEYFFEESLLISPIDYYTRAWTVLESEHFKFLVSDTMQFNAYCIDNLERYFDEISKVLEFSNEDMAAIRTHKLTYVLCQDEEQMELLTGYRARGMFNLAYDCVITRFNAHYHELVHQSVNFKLRTLPMYTHPMLQEGLAVALGGRGGKEPGPILSLGAFLARSGMINHTALLTKSDFYSNDPSMSYPLSGLYNRFLLTELGISKYLDLYRRYSGTSEQVDSMRIVSADLPADSAWQAFLGSADSFQAVDVYHEDVLPHSADPEANGLPGPYRFAIADTMLFGGSSDLSHFQSKQFIDLFGNREYRGEKYAIIADPNEISVYNLYTNNLIAKLVGGFMNPPIAIEKIDDRYQFTVDRNVFDEDLSDLLLGRR